MRKPALVGGGLGRCPRALLQRRSGAALRYGKNLAWPPGAGKICAKASRCCLRGVDRSAGRSRAREVGANCFQKVHRCACPDSRNVVEVQDRNVGARPPGGPRVSRLIIPARKLIARPSRSAAASAQPAKRNRRMKEESAGRLAEYHRNPPPPPRAPEARITRVTPQGHRWPASGGSGPDRAPADADRSLALRHGRRHRPADG